MISSKYLWERNVSDKYCVGILFVDSATGFTRTYHLVSLRSGDILRYKQAFERDAFEYGICVQGYHGSNRIFACTT